MKRQQPLEQHADSVRVLRLQGFLFFGAANRIREEIRQESDNSVDYLILDFHNVVGVDDTAMPVLKSLESLARERGFELIVSGARAVIEYRMHRLESRHIPCLDAAF